MDPYDNQRDTANRLTSGRDTDSTAGTSGGDHTPDDPHRDAPDSGNTQATNRQPRYLGGFTVIPPNESQRSKIKMMAQKEEEDLQRWKEANRPPPVHLNPEKLGGDVTLAAARERQFTNFRCSKLQKKLKKEELDKRRRQEEEEELQRKKDKQRETAERQEEKKRQEEQRRREQLRQDHVRTTESFLQRFERTSISAAHTSSRSEAVESQQRERESKSERDIQLEHRRVNSAFLDKLEGRGRGSEKKTEEEGDLEAERPVLTPEGFRHQPSNAPGQQLPPAHLNLDPEQSYSGWAEDADPDYDWALMKLINSFPDCSRVFLEDILNQCNRDYEQAFTLLICTLN